MADAVMPIRESVACAKMAEERGFSDFWASDMSPREAYVPLTACAIATNKIKLGTAITVATARNPMVTAGIVKCLDELSGNRTVLGLGVGSTWTKEAGIVTRQPVKLMKEYVEVMRRIFSAAKFPFNGRFYSIKGLHWWKGMGYLSPRSRVPPIYTAAVGAKMIQLAGEVSDGIILGSINSPKYIKIARRHLEKGAKRAGRDASDVDFAALKLTFVGNDSRAMKKFAKFRLAAYSALPSYETVLKLMGYCLEREKIVDAMRRGDFADAVNAVPDRMVEDIALAGTAEECRTKLEEYRRAGLTHPIVYPILTEGRKPRKVYGEAIDGLAS